MPASSFPPAPRQRFRSIVLDTWKGADLYTGLTPSCLAILRLAGLRPISLCRLERHNGWTGGKVEISYCHSEKLDPKRAKQVAHNFPTSVISAMEPPDFPIGK